MVMHSHPSPPIGFLIPELARAIFQLIQKGLRLTAGQTHLLFLIANSSCLSHPRAWLGKPYCLTSAASELTFCFRQRGCVSVYWLGAGWELFVTELNFTSFANHE